MQIPLASTSSPQPLADRPADMKVLIAVPTFETIAPECFKAIYELQGDDLTFDFVRGYDCAKARNEIAKKALNGGFDYVLMVDSDIVIPPDTLVKMLDAPVNICFGVYPRKNKPGETELFKDDTFDFTNRYTYEELSKEDANKIPVKGSGFGCALIKTDVFANIEYPWFEFYSYDNGTFLSEDLAFCMKASIRYRLLADIRVKCGHIAKQVQYE